MRVEHAGALLAASDRAWRVLETSHPPTYYVPWDAVVQELLVPVAVTSFCEWKGQATWWGRSRASPAARAGSGPRGRGGSAQCAAATAARRASATYAWSSAARPVKNGKASVRLLASSLTGQRPSAKP